MLLIYQPTNSIGNHNYNAFIYEDANWYMHFHKSLELVYVIKGEVKAFLDENEFRIVKDDFFLVLPNQIHGYASQGTSKIWVGVFSEDYVREFIRIMKNKIGDSPIFTCNKEELLFLKSSLLKKEVPELITLKACLYIACGRYLKSVKLKDFKKQDDSIIYKIIEYTEKNFKNDITLKQMASDLGYEYHYISKKFNNFFHINFRSFVNQYRFECAQNLILDKNLNMTQVAMESGFGSIRNFNRIYKALSNTPPKKHL